MKQVTLCAAIWLLAVAPAWAQDKDQPRPADEKTLAAALKAYDGIKPGMLKLDFEALARTLADNRRPVLPRADQTDDAVAEVAAKLRKNAKDLERTRDLLAEVEKAKPKPGKAMMQEATVKGMKVTLVKIPLPGTKALAEKYKVTPGRWTGDDEGNLAVLMVRHDGAWFWNPFGW